MTDTDLGGLAEPALYARVGFRLAGLTVDLFEAGYVHRIAHDRSFGHTGRLILIDGEDEAPLRNRHHFWMSNIVVRFIREFVRNGTKGRGLSCASISTDLMRSAPTLDFRTSRRD